MTEGRCAPHGAGRADVATPPVAARAATERLAARCALLALGLCAALAGCDGGSGRKMPIAGCTLAQQKQAVAGLMEEWYLFNDEPEQRQKYASLDLEAFTAPEDLLAALLYRPERYDRHFSFLTTLAQDRQFFGEGRFIGFGFGSKFADPPVNGDLRLTQVFAGSPAAAAGLARGQRILAIGGRTIATIGEAEGIAAALGPSEVGVSRSFSIRRLDGSEFEVEITKAIVTIDPVPLAKTIDVGSATVGYLDLRTFVSTADAELEQAFAGFASAGVTALVVDVRYNGGGLVATAHGLADLIAGFVAAGRVQSRTLHNAEKSALDAVTHFERLPNSLSLLQQVAFITTASSASASELLVNALKPHTVVWLVGAATFGKPVGQDALSYCDGRLLRAVTFETVNALGEGRYYDGLPADCTAADDLERPLGDPLEASLAGALAVIDTGACPAPSGFPKPGAGATALGEVPWSPDAGHARRYADAF